MTDGAIGAMPSHDLLEDHGRSVSSAVSAMQPERSPSATAAAKQQSSFAGDGTCARSAVTIAGRLTFVSPRR